MNNLIKIKAVQIGRCPYNNFFRPDRITAKTKQDEAKK